MPRKHAVTRIDVLGKPDAIPVRDIGEYVRSKESNDLYIKAPVWDSIGDSLEEVYFAARVEHEAMTREREKLMEQQTIQTSIDTNRYKRLLQSQAQLRHRFVRVNVFLRDFEDKRKSAMKKGTAELAMQQEIRDASYEIHEVLDILGEFRDLLKRTTDEYEPYEKVLEDVVKQTPVITSVKDLMDRCDALMLAQVEIVELGNQKVSELETMRKRLVAVAREAALQVMGLKNALSSLDRLYEAARTECLKWEKNLERVQSTINRGIGSKERVLEGIAHIFRLLCQRRSLYAGLPHEAVEGRMDFIKAEVELLQDVLMNCEKHKTKSEDGNGKLKTTC